MRPRRSPLTVTALALPRDLDVDLAGFDPHQPRDHRGRWAQTPGSLARAAIAGGFTVATEDMSPVTHGFVVARPGTVFLPADNVEVAAKEIAKFLNDHPDVKHLGGWYNPEDQKVYLDIVDIVADRDEAVRLGSKRNQIAVFDLDTMSEINTGGTGEDQQAGPDLASGELGRDDARGAAGLGREGGSGDGRTREVDLAHHFDPNQPRDPHTGEWTKTETRAWLDRHPVKAKHIVDMWDSATEGEKVEGQRWYPEAHKVALALSKRYGVSVEEAAGLLATYSPQTPWGQNIRYASEALREHRALGGPGEHIFWHRDPNTPDTFEEREGIMAPGTARTRAERIMAGEAPDEVFAGGRNKNGTLKPNSLKIRAFFELIATGESDPKRPAVVIDRHAAGVARGVRMTDEDYNIAGPSTSIVKFSEYVDAYRKAAKTISKKEGRTITPEMVQAATWLARQRINAANDSQVSRTRHKLGNRDSAMISAYAQQYLPEALADIPKVGYAELANDPYLDIDLAHPSLRRTRYVTSQLLDGADPADLLRKRGIYGPVADAVAKMVGTGTAHRPNARLHGHDLTLGIRIERDREALYRGAYLLKAGERVNTAILEGKSLKEAIADERRYHRMHEEARRNRLLAVTRAQRIAKMVGEPEGNRTLVGWYLNPLLANDPECVAANGHNFYAEEGTIIGFPGAVHLNCGCVAGPPIEGAGMVNDAVRGVVPITHIPSRPKFAARRKPRMSA